MLLKALLFLTSLTITASTVHFQETFDDPSLTGWVKSTWKQNSGVWSHSPGAYFGDENDKGLQTTQDNRFYAISRKFPSFSNENANLVIQYQIRFPQKVECGGGYLKIGPSSLDQAEWGGTSKYHIMFGPDLCGTSIRKVQVIFYYARTQELVPIKKEILAENDVLSHVYTLIVRPNNTYEVRIDGIRKEWGSLFDDFDFLPPKRIKASSPYSKPQDWDDEVDGVWQAPPIPTSSNTKPLFYPEIPNPHYFEDHTVYRYPDIGFVGIDIWQVKSGTIFDNIIVSDSIEEAEMLLQETFLKNHEKEKASFELVSGTQKVPDTKPQKKKYQRHDDL